MKKTTQATISILIALALMATIFYSSSMSYQDQSLVGLIQKWLPGQPFSQLLSKIRFYYAGKLISVPSLGYAQFIEFFLRKGAHFFFYFLIAYHWARGLRVFVKHQGLAFGLALFITCLYAVTDEFHQALTPNRTPLVYDVLLDSMGALLGSLIGWFHRIR